jgi:hypothetical protein
MLRIEATIRSDTHIPFSITGTGTDRVSPKVKTHHAGSDGNVVACELNLSGSQLVVGCACFRGGGQASLVGPSQAVVFRTVAFNTKVFTIPSSDCFASAPLFLSTRRLKMKAVWKGNSLCN